MKKFKTFACTMVMAIIMVVSASAVDFVDVDSDAWYYGAVTTLTERGIVSGTGEGQFSPERFCDCSGVCYDAGSFQWLY